MKDPLRRTLERLDGPVRPEPGFADELFVRLLGEAGARRGPLRRMTGVVRRAPEGVRRAMVAAAALGLVAAVFLLTLPLFVPSEPAALGEYGEMPPFRGVVEFTVSPDLLVGIDSDELTSGTHRIEVVYAGSNAWRFESLDDGLGSILPPVAGSIGAWDGERFRIYDAGQNAFGEQAIGSAGFTILNPLAWTATGDGWEEICRDPEVSGSDALLGRGATSVECAGRSAGIRLWLDEQTGLVLRAEVASGAASVSFEGPIGPGPGGGFRFVEVEYGSVTDVDAAFDPPPDAVPFEDVVTPPTTLTIGEPVPSLPGLETAGLDVTPSNGRPTAIYPWASWCAPCTGEPLDAFDEEAVALAGELNAYSVAFLDEPDLASEIFEAEGYRVPLIHDTEGELGSWGVEAIPTLVLLDGEGRLLGAYAGDLDGEDVRAILRAVVNGEPLPDVGGNTTKQIA